jgi:YHS domain-containing protein
MKSKVILLTLLVVALAFAGCSPAAEEPAPEAPADEPADVVSGPTQSIVTDEASLIEAVGPNGGWIVIFEDDMTTEQELVLAAGPTDEGEAARKLALYTQDADRNVLDRFTLTAPSLTVESVNSRIQGGTFAGDVYVTAEGFQLRDAVIDGNLYFASQELLDAFENEGEVTGTIGVEADAVSAPTQSFITDEASLINALGANGGWIVIFEDDMSTDKDLVLAAGPTDEGEPARKLALYTQDADRNVTARFTLTAPTLTVESVNSRIQGGTFEGDVYVKAEGFQLRDAVIDGHLYFASQELLDAFENEGEVTGQIGVEADVVSGATQSIVTDEDSLVEAFSAAGGWIVIFEDDMSTDKDLVLAAGPTDEGEPARKLALYTQDADRNVTARFTLTAPTVTVESVNSRIQGGTVAGDVYVTAEGFQLRDAVIDGNLYFASQELLDAFENEGEVTGEIAVQ